MSKSQRDQRNAEAPLMLMRVRAEAAEAERDRLREELIRLSKAERHYVESRLRAEAENSRLRGQLSEIAHTNAPVIRDLGARAEAAEAERDRLREALLAWWEPQRHVGNCECQACTLTRAALATTKEGT